MAINMYKNVALFIVVAFCVSKAALSPLASGKGLGMDGKVDNRMAETPRWLRGALSTLKDKTAGAAEVDEKNPALRSKRSSTCSIPANLPEAVRDLNNNLNQTQFVGLNPLDSQHVSIPANQPRTCPNATRGEWPTGEPNMRSTCPWTITEKDLGENAFPRYVKEAFCLCERCMDSSSKSCAQIRQEITYFYREGCQGKLAKMTTRTVSIVVGCHCVSAGVQGSVPGPQPQESE